MAAPKTDYSEEFFEGMSVAKLAQLFRMDRRTVTEKLRSLRPTGERRGAPTYHVVDAAPYLVEPVVDIAEYLQNVGPADLPPQLQAVYWAGQNGKLKYKEQAGDLWRTQQVLSVFTAVFRSISQTLRLFADRMDAKLELTPEQRKYIETQISDKLVVMIRKRLVEDFEIYSGVKDKEQLADIEMSGDPFEGIDDDE